MKMNKIVGRYVLLSYPTFSQEFIIHTDSRKTHLGGVVIQNGNPIEFYSHRLTSSQINYKVTER